MANADTPSLDEIVELTRSELTIKQDDEIQECGPACIELLPRDPDMCLQVAYQHLYDVPYKEVKTCWRRLYTDSALRLALDVLEKRNRGKLNEQVNTNEEVEGEARDWVADVVNILDMTLVLTAAPGREELVELWFAALRGALGKDEQEAEEAEGRPAKRRKVEADDRSSLSATGQTLEIFPATITTSPSLRCPIPRVSNISLEGFQTKIAKADTQTPIVIEGAIYHWPALDDRPWNRPKYLLEKTLGGRRLVPVEIGRSYTDQGWGQKILSFGEFMKEYMFQHSTGSQDPVASKQNGAHGHEVHITHSEQPDGLRCGSSPKATDKIAETSSKPPQTGYLAQHDLFAQIPSLRADISIPDYCYADPAPQPTNLSNVKSVAKLDEPLLNAWFGPANTISPLHTDPYHNILAQVVGYKYVRLYAPDQTAKLYPRSVDENGIDMSNTSEVDLDVAMDTWSDISCWPGVRGKEKVGEEEDEAGDWTEMFKDFRQAKYVEGVLGPGECLYVPVGWWHYVRSLTPSFSVSFWFN